jgi:nitrite reductase/ring-hydroxylating ferredoxin subunit
MKAVRTDGGYELGPASELSAGTLCGVALDDRRIVVANVDGKYIAFDERCPHLSIPLSQGSLAANGCLTCIGHGSVFEMPEGSVRKWMGRRPGLISKLLSGKPSPVATKPVSIIDGNLFLPD